MIESHLTRYVYNVFSLTPQLIPLDLRTSCILHVLLVCMYMLQILPSVVHVHQFGSNEIEVSRFLETNGLEI